MATGASTSRSHFGHRSNPTVADVVSSCALMDFGRFLCPSYFFRGIDHRCWMSVLKVPWKKGASGTSGTSDPSGSLHGQWTPNERWSDPQGDPVRSGQILFSILLQHCLHTSPWALHESQPNSMDGILILDFQVMKDSSKIWRASVWVKGRFRFMAVRFKSIGPWISYFYCHPGPKIIRHSQ